MAFLSRLWPPLYESMMIEALGVSFASTGKGRRSGVFARDWGGRGEGPRWALLRHVPLELVKGFEDWTPAPGPGGHGITPQRETDL